MEIQSEVVNFTIRRIEPSDYEAVYQIFSGPRAVWGTLQVPFPSAESWRKRLAEPRDGSYHLAACAGNEMVGQQFRLPSLQLRFLGQAELAMDQGASC